MIPLTNEQKNVLYQLVQGVKAGVKIQTLGGLAGTGKSTLIQYISKFFPNFAVAAFTGKAADVLRRKGLEFSSTIHKCIYIPDIQNGVLVDFVLAGREDLQCNGFIIDEASMVSKDIYEDLIHYGLPIIFIGDHGQLEPVGDTFNLMMNPMYRLETIHRNANDIAKFAYTLRQGRSALQFRGTEDRVVFKQKNRLSDDDLMNYSQIICAYNATRVEYNKKIRAILGYGNDLQPGERIICLKNNHSSGLFNGMQCTVLRTYKGEYAKTFMDIAIEGADPIEKIWYDTRYFNVEKPDFEYVGADNPTPFDYGYCCTTHKVQGSEYQSALVIEQKCRNWDHARWAYTAASRAKESLLWAYGY